ncbi:DUF4129 domain-containing protein [Microbacterium alcoholitolerans]|uniref:DUF4129 domain-containing protein n=1 Tax=unclassified Microbacterium TaxID=2609290 RepID=UPI003D16AAAC
MPVDADQESAAPASVIPSRVSRWALPSGVILLFVIAMLASAVAGHPVFAPGEAAPEPLPQPTEQQTLPPIGLGDPQRQQADDTLLLIISIVMVVLVVAAALAALVLVIRAVLVYWRSRPLRRTAGVATDVAMNAETVAESIPDASTVRRGIAAARATIDLPSDAGDAIIAAWIGLEETAVDSGVGRGRSETPGEFTLRILLHRPGIEDPARRLLRLYESVRFGGHRADEAMREDAARALADIEEGWR